MVLPSYSGSVAGYSSYSAYRIDLDITRSMAMRYASNFCMCIFSACYCVQLKPVTGNTVTFINFDDYNVVYVRGRTLGHHGGTCPSFKGGASFPFCIYLVLFICR